MRAGRQLSLEIARRTVEKMKEEFDSNPADLYSCNWSCISMKYFECGEDVISAISNVSVKRYSWSIYIIIQNLRQVLCLTPIVNKAVLMSNFPES